ncbi:hypothetical protein ARAM_005762 [Aspergillus rambellii]|uniref:Filamentation protein n=1 Tax=Aspergillus rambellii TaxID=308745 RepID=A0A0F8UAA2_9EURO|nr:hypothetical protein ARAM_005762 [Aspergillus rambellii]
MAGRESEKGHRYIVALDNARCQNKWDEVPELIRKVTKHAPQKTCLLDVASAEYLVTTQVHRSSSAARPASASPSSLPELIPSLLSTIEKADGSNQELFQAEVCLGWVHFTLNEPGLAVARLPKDFDETLNNLTTVGDELSPWTKICLVKGCYIKAAAQNAVSGPTDALETFSSLAQWLASHGQALSPSSSQFLHWSEKLLAEGALVAGEEICRNFAAATGDLVRLALQLFRAWASHPSVKAGTSSPDVSLESYPEPIPKSKIWKFYYDLLSAVLQNDLPYTPPTDGPERPQLASEVQRVQATCEANLIREAKFPTAHSDNKQVEAWVDQVIRNWNQLCGSQWDDEELGEGGQNAMGRNVVEILYRAAAKTYHSHLILRRLFHVHAALAEFDLAFKALDSYIEIVMGAKQRAEKAVPYEELEDDGVFMRTLAEGITVLCCFGSGKEAEKTKDLISTLKKFIGKYVKDSEEEQERKIVFDSKVVSPSDIGAAYRAIGIGLATWASWTPVNEERDDIRAEAIECLERSIAPELEDEFNYSSLYTLSLLLAESRDLDAAIDYVKSALASNKQSEPTAVDFGHERDLFPLWHLLALLLSAKQEFDIAERSCEAAFEQFPATVTSLAHSDRRPPKNRNNQQEQAGMTLALINRLRNRERERIIETRITQLAFVEVLEGPGAALNHSEQLLSLFATLFRTLDFEEKGNIKPDQLSRPKSSSGTIKSFRGSIFGRKVSRMSDHKITLSGELRVESLPQTRSSNPDPAPAIQVIGEEQPKSRDGHPTVSRSDSRKLRKRSNTVKKADGSAEQNLSRVNGDGPEINEPNGENGSALEMANDAISRAASQPQSAKQTLAPVPHNMKHSRMEPPVGHSKQPPEQDIQLPTSYAFESPTGALTKFPHAHTQKHALCVLVKVWLLIAGLYRRSSSFDDAAEACEEAAKHVKRIETLIAASQDASAQSFRERGWAVPKSPDELWADIYAERGLLLVAQSRPHEAMEHFEEALVYNSDHPKATISLASQLLDIWDQKLPLQPREQGVETGLSTTAISSPPGKPTTTSGEVNGNKLLGKSGLPDSSQENFQTPTSTVEDDGPKLINRIAARERAYGLLSALTKRGSSWDNSEAWFVLSRAYEAVGQVQKLKEVLWWCIELEDRRPIRHWSNIGSGVYVL